MSHERPIALVGYDQAQKATTRSIIQKLATPPIAYGGTQRNVGRQRARHARAPHASPSIAPTKRSWPTSTPTLKHSNATGIAFDGKPICASAPANPRP